MNRTLVRQLVAANFVVALASVLVFKVALFLYSTSGAEAHSGRWKTLGKLWLCLGWDVFGAALVALLALLLLLSVGRWRMDAAVRACQGLQSLHGFYLAVSFEVARAIGTPPEKAAIDLAFFNVEATSTAGWSMASSLAPSLTLSFAFRLVVAGVIPAVALPFAINGLNRWDWFGRRVARPSAALLVALLLTTTVILPNLRTVNVVVHTYGLERSPLPLILGSYLRDPVRRLTTGEPPPADPFCLDLRPPPAAGAAISENPLRAARPRRTNVLVVVLESVSTRTLAQRPTPMPFFEALGREENTVLFGEHYSTWPQTMKSLFSLFCAEHPHPHYSPITYTNPAIPCVSLPEALKRVGYQTALFTSADLGYDRQIRFFKHRRFDRITDRHTMPGRQGHWANSWGIDETVTVRALLSWLDARASDERPFFATYNMVAGHHPYEAPGVAAARADDPVGEAAAFWATLHHADEQLRVLIDGLRARGLLGTTLVAVVADHGPGSGRTGMGRARDPTVYEGSVHVPLVLHGPQLEAVNGPVKFPTSHVDLAPTLLGLVQVEPPITMKGRDLTRESEGRLILMATRPPVSQIGVRAGRWKAVLWQETGAAELFDLDSDQGERYDRAAEHPELTAALVAAGKRWQVHSRGLIENYAAILRSSGRRCRSGVAGSVRGASKGVPD